MLTWITMILIAAFLGCLLIIRDTQGKKNRFFDLDTTTTMRGFWCLVVMLVHVPELYQNKIQNLLGSFAYIGVTFFFMTSSYGLMLAVKKSPDAALKGFWKRRLPKLLVPMLAVNVLTLAVDSLMGEASVRTLVSMTGFVRQLLLFYFVFWVVFKLPIPGLDLKCREWLLCGCVAAISLLIYVTNGMGLFSWPVESLGFLYGVLLAQYADSFTKKLSSGWLLKCAVGCVLALILGVLYLQVKHEIFWGDYVVKILLGGSILTFVLGVNTKYALGNAVGRFLGGISYEVYLIHGLAFRWVHHACGQINSGLYILVSMIVAVLLSAAVQWASKWILRCMR